MQGARLLFRGTRLNVSSSFIRTVLAASEDVGVGVDDGAPTHRRLGNVPGAIVGVKCGTALRGREKIMIFLDSRYHGGNRPPLSRNLVKRINMDDDRSTTTTDAGGFVFTRDNGDCFPPRWKFRRKRTRLGWYFVEWPRLRRNHRGEQRAIFASSTSTKFSQTFSAFRSCSCKQSIM